MSLRFRDPWGVQLKGYFLAARLIDLLLHEAYGTISFKDLADFMKIRAYLHAEKLHEQGMSWEHIGEQMGLSRQAIHNYGSIKAPSSDYDAGSFGLAVLTIIPAEGDGITVSEVQAEYHRRSGECPELDDFRRLMQRFVNDGVVHVVDGSDPARHVMQERVSKFASILGPNTRPGLRRRSALFLEIMENAYQEEGNTFGLTLHASVLDNKGFLAGAMLDLEKRLIEWAEAVEAQSEAVSKSSGAPMTWMSAVAALGIGMRELDPPDGSEDPDDPDD